MYKPDGKYFVETYIKDHLGNIRVSYGNDGVKDGIRQVNAYYPFGMNMKELSANSSYTVHRNEYQYNGKMFQDELGLDWYDYGARFYDPVIGRWHSVDPLAEKAASFTPYHYCFGNPIIFVDPDGKWPWEAKNVRDARKEKRATGGEFDKWKGEDKKSWASIEYRDTKINEEEGAFCQVFKPEGSSWAERLSKDGGNDLLNSGGTKKEGWAGAGKIITISATGVIQAVTNPNQILSSPFQTVNVMFDFEETIKHERVKKEEDDTN